jgi:putative heme-binding domain-containing protein
MRPVLSFLAALVTAAPSLAQPKLPSLPPDLMAPTDALSPADERKAFNVPDGFDVQLVASEPDIQKPIQMAFDAKGRLWVATSYHYPFAAQEKPNDKIFVLSDFDAATGRAKKVQVFADDLNIPIGILPLPDGNSCIVSSVGEIRKYTDTKGTGRADAMEVLYKGFGFRDTHGMYNSFTLMPDGWVYACHGFSNESTVKGKDGHEVKMQSGNTFRFRPDGSRIEVWTRGQVNPFGIAVDPWFNLYTADCHSKPITQLIPGGYYDSFGKPHDGLGYAPHVVHHDHGSTALCGLTWYDADQFPKEYLGTMFLGNVVTNRINFDKIEWKGATPVGIEQPDFLVSKDRWFRPVDIKLGPDGALYVADFYNKIIGHYEVDLKDPRRDKDRGRVWRIVWTGKDGKAPAAKAHRADWTTAKDVELIDDLFHPNLTVRFLAGHQLRQRSANGKDIETDYELLAKLAKHPDRIASVAGWIMFITQAGKQPATLKDYETILPVADDPRNGVKPEACTGQVIRALASRSDWDAGARTLLLTVFKSLHSARQTLAAVEAVIAHPHADFVKPLVAVLNNCPAADTHLRHAAKIALRNCLRDDPTAWEQADGDIFVEMAIAIPDRKASKYLVARLGAKTIPADKLNAAAEHVARYGAVVDTDSLFAALSAVYNVDALQAAFKGVQARGAKLGAETAARLFQRAGDAIASSAFQSNPTPAEVSLAYWGVQVLNMLPAVMDRNGSDYKLGSGAVKGLTRMLAAPNVPDEVRVGAADALVAFGSDEGLNLVRGYVADPSAPEGVRHRLFVVFASAGNRDARRDARDALKTVPYRVAVSVALALASRSAGAEELLEAVRAGNAPARLLQEKAVIERLKGSNPADWEKRVAKLTEKLPAADQRIAELLKARADGFGKAKPDKVEGAKLFTRHCAACHRVGDVGGKIAPQLDGVGVRGVERLLEDVLDPNRNVDIAFRARSITLKSEKTITALMLRVDGEVLVVADLEGKEQRVPLDEIDTNRETMLSAMPANFADAIPEGDLYHIVAYLLDQKAKEPPKK